MSLSERLGQLNRVQRTLWFRLGATALVVLMAVGLAIGLWIASRDLDGIMNDVAMRAQERSQRVVAGTEAESGPVGVVRDAIDSALLSMQVPDAEELRDRGLSEEFIRRAIDSASPWSVVGAIGVVAALAIGVVWLGLGLSYTGILLAGWVPALILSYIPGLQGLGTLLFGAIPLALAFLTGMETLKIALSGPSPVLAVARNVLAEAVRMKISIVFIVLLILLLSTTPSLLNDEQPLRYRVQNWLQYGTGLSFVVLALLTLFFSTATVAFEQRDKVIWQTMTKPVRAWEYILGKWSGVVALNAVLLTVTASGVYLFTEYLRRQPAHGEIAYQVDYSGQITRGFPERQTEDRRLLESQVLVARTGRGPEAFNILASEYRMSLAIDNLVANRLASDSSLSDTPALRRELRQELTDQFETAIDNAIQAEIEDAENRAGGPLRATPSAMRNFRREVLDRWESRYRTVPLGGMQTYLFTGIDPPRGRDRASLTLQYNINAGTNDPSKVYRVFFDINGQQFERQVALDAAQRMLFHPDLVGDDGIVQLTVLNAEGNDRDISFPPDGLEILSIAGGYELNFTRIMFVMWVKLAFIAAVGVAASTFLSFPVACLVTMSILFMAESAGFLQDSLRDYTAMTTEGRDWVATVVRLIAVPVAWTFSVYAESKPTASLVDGRLLSWLALAKTIIVLGLWSLAGLATGWLIFRQRELATYSGK